MNIHVNHDEQAKIFLVEIAGKMAKLSYKKIDDKTLDYYSTFVPPEFRGKNIGEQLVKTALDYAKNNHYQIIPSCPFVQRIIERHPEYQPLLVQQKK